MNALLSPIPESEHRTVGTVDVDVARCGAVRVKRMIYPPGFHWTKDLSASMGEWCMHSHVGFLAQGQINVRFEDGCVQEYKAPQFVAVEPGHQGWVVGDESAVLVEFDMEGDTSSQVSLPAVHRSGGSCPKAQRA